MTSYKISMVGKIQKAFTVIPLLLLIFTDYAATEEVKIVQAGDNAGINYICRLKTGEVVAATDAVPENQPKSNIFMRRKDTGPLPVVAARPDGPSQVKQEEPFEDEIVHRLSGIIIGMKVGERRPVTLTPRIVAERDEKNYVARLARVRTRQKEMKMSLDEYKNRARKDPEVGQAFAIDPAFPGKVEAVTARDVTIRFSATPGDMIETPFGPGHISEEGQSYKVDIDARKGGLTRMGGLIGRIVDVDERFITVDYRYPFGGESLDCDVTIEKVADATPVKNGTGEAR